MVERGPASASGMAKAAERRAMSAADFSPIDCDFHPVVPNLQALLPYLEDHWRESVN
jgi:hypothetical protein